MTATQAPGTALFEEPGGRWRAVAYGPILCLAVLLLELVTSSPVHWFALIFCGALIAGFVTLQVTAARRHVSVALTDSMLREGTETLPLSSIVEVLPERDENAWDEDEWESARALGELTGVPRRRTGIGLRLTEDVLVQAWARDHKTLRALLTDAVGQSAQAASSVESSDGVESPVRESPSAADAETGESAAGVGRAAEEKQGRDGHGRDSADGVNP